MDSVPGGALIPFPNSSRILRYSTKASVFHKRAEYTSKGKKRVKSSEILRMTSPFMQIPLFKLLAQAFWFLSAIFFRKIFHVHRKALDPHSAQLSFPHIQPSYASTWCHYLPGCPRQPFTSLSLFSACPSPPVCSKSARMVSLPAKSIF